MNKKLGSILIVVAVFGIGFFSGMEFKGYQIRKALNETFSDTPEETVMESAKIQKSKIIKRSVGDEIALSTVK